MIILRAIFQSLGIYFLIIPIIIYVICKIKYKGEELPKSHVSFERRALAYVMDGLFFLLFDFLIKTGYSKSPVPIPLPPGLIIFCLSFTNIIILPSITGWSLGKLFLSIKIVKKDNKKAGLVDIIYREIVKNWFSVTFVYLGCLWMIFGKDKLTWHDSVADTRIVMIENDADTIIEDNEKK